MEKRFVKSRDNKVLTGILGGMAAYFGLSARLLRICFFIISWLFAWPAYIYLILMFAMPEENERYEEAGTAVSNLKLPLIVKRWLSRFLSSLNEACAVLFKE